MKIKVSDNSNSSQTEHSEKALPKKDGVVVVQHAQNVAQPSDVKPGVRHSSLKNPPPLPAPTEKEMSEVCDVNEAHKKKRHNPNDDAPRVENNDDEKCAALLLTDDGASVASTEAAAGESFLSSSTAKVIAGGGLLAGMLALLAGPGKGSGHSFHSYDKDGNDKAGNGDEASPIIPTQTASIASLTDSVGVFTGAYTAVQSTDDTTLALTGTVSSTLSTGDVVTIFDNGARLGEATVDMTEPSAPVWSFTTSSLKPGQHQFAVAVENNGILGVSSSAMYANVTNISAVTNTSGTLSGTLEAPVLSGETIGIYDGTTRLGSATLNAAGTSWTYSTTGMAYGNHIFTAKVENARGAVLIESVPADLVISPSQVVAIVSATDNVGVRQADISAKESTDDSSLVLNGTLSSALLADDEIVVYQGNTRLGVATVDASNPQALTWTYSPALLDVGKYSFTARVENSIGLNGGISDAFVTNITSMETIKAYDNVGYEQGYLTSGEHADDSTPTMSGTLAAPLLSTERIAVYDGSNLLGYASVDAAGTNWSYTPSALGYGTHTLVAKVENTNGTDLMDSSSFSFTVVIVPAQTVAITAVDATFGTTSTDIPDKGTTNDSTPLISGTLSSALLTGDTVVVYDGALVLGTATVDTKTLTWTFAPSSLGSGTYDLSARVVSNGGEVGALSATRSFTLTGMSSISAADDVGASTGPLTNGAITDDSVPKLSGTLDTSLLSGQKIAIYGDGTFLGYATVGADNQSWSYTPSALSYGQHKFAAQLQDANGNMLLKTADFGLTIIPAQTVTITSATDNVGVLQADIPANQSTDDSALTLKGTLSSALLNGDSVAVYDKLVRLGTATVNSSDPANLTWSFGTATLGDGTHSFTARVENSGGQNGVVSAIFNTNVTELGAISAHDNVGESTGSISNRGTTDDATPTLSGSLNAALLTGEKVGIYEGTTRLGTAAVTVTGGITSWSFTPTGLSYGSHTLTAKVENANGTVLMESSTFTLTVIPSQTVTITSATDNVGVRQTNIPSSESTDDTTLVLNGTLSAPLTNNDSVAVYDGTTRLGIATLDSSDPANLLWTFNTPTLSSGTHNFTARVENSSGQNGGTSAVFSTNESGLSSISASSNSTTVAVPINSGGSTDDATPALSGTLNAPLLNGEKVVIYDGVTRLGNAAVTTVNGVTGWSYTPTALAYGSHTLKAVVEKADGTDLMESSTFTLTVIPAQKVEITSATDDVGVRKTVIPSGESTDDTTLVLNGTLSAALLNGDTVVVYDGNTRLGTATVNNSNPQALTWSYATAALTNGTHSFTARVENSGGQNGAVSTAFNTNVTGLSIISATDNVEEGSGTVTINNDGRTDDATPAFSGTLNSALLNGELVGIYDGTTRLGDATLTTVGGVTSWSYTPTNLTYGLHSITARVEKADGTDLINSDVFKLTEYPAQKVVITSVVDNVGTQQGNVVTKGTTDDITPTIKGTLSSALLTGDQLYVYDGTTRLGPATVNTQNPQALTWSLDIGPLTGGIHTLTARVENSGGQKGDVSKDYEFIVSGISIDTFTDNTPTPQGGAFDTGTLPTTTTARYVRISNFDAGKLTLAEVSVYAMVDGVLTNVALNKPVSYGGGASQLYWNSPIGYINDGANGSYSHIAQSSTRSGWVQIDLGQSYKIVSMSMYNPTYPNISLSLSETSMGGITNDDIFKNDIAGVTTYINPDPNQSSYDAPLQVTDEHTPVLSGNIARVLESGEKLYIYNGTTRLGEATIDTATGRWTFTPPASLASNGYNFVAKVENNTTVLMVSDAFSVEIVPQETVNITGITTTEGTTGTVEIANGGVGFSNTPTLQGTISSALRAEEKLAIYDGYLRIGYATVDSSKLTWTYNTSSLAQGVSHSFTARVEATRTTAGALFGSPSSSYTYNNFGDNITAADNAGHIQGNIGGSGQINTTDDKALSLSGALSAALPTDKVIEIYDGSLSLGVAVLNSTRTAWTFVTPDLSLGSHSLSAVVKNSTGDKLNTSNILNITEVDPAYVPPQNVTITELKGTDNSLTIDGHSVYTGQKISGTYSSPLNPGDVLVLLNNGVVVENTPVTVNTSNSTWSVNYSNLAFNTLTVAVYNQATGALGNQSNVVTFNQTTYLNFVLSDDAGLVTGDKAMPTTSANPLVTDDKQPVLIVNLASGNGILATERMGIYIDGVYAGDATLNNSRTIGTFTPSTDLALGNHTFSVKIESMDGSQSYYTYPGYVNITDVTSTTIINPVTLDSFRDNSGTTQGTYSPSTSTDDTTPTLNGTLGAALEANDKVVVYDGSTRLGYATVNTTNLTWSFTTGVLSATEHTLKARVENAVSGGIGSWSNDFKLNEVSVAVSSAMDDYGLIRGQLPNSDHTDDTMPLLTGTLSTALRSGETLGIYDGSTYLGNAVINNTTLAWSYEVNSPLTNGAHVLTAKVQGSTNEVLLTSSNFNLTITAPDTLNVVAQSMLNGPMIGNNTTLPGAQVQRDTQMDWTGLSHLKVDRVDLGNSQSSIKLALSDVLQADANSFDSSIFSGLVTQAGQHQMVITGSNSGSLTVADGTFSFAQDVTAGGVIFHVYNTTDNAAQLIVDSSIKHTSGSVIG